MLPGKGPSSIRKVVFISISFLFFLPFLGQVNGDGCVMVAYEDLSYILEEDQTAFIAYRDGVQMMSISINFQAESGRKAAWILPIPSDPDNIRMAIETASPSMEGEDIQERADEEFESIRKEEMMLYLSSAVPMGRVAYGFVLLTSMDDATEGKGYGRAGDDDPDVIVHLETNLMGISSELISASSGESVYQYMRSRGLDVEDGMIGPLDHYVSNDFSFILTWLEDLEDERVQPGIYVEFPTDRIFYPMLLTSLYGDEKVPVNIVIVGAAIPDLNQEIKNDATVRYYQGRLVPPSIFNLNVQFLPGYYPEMDYEEWEELVGPFKSIYRSSFMENLTGDTTGIFGGHEYSGTLTLVEIDSEARNYNADIYFDLGEPDAIKWDKTVNDNSEIPLIFNVKRFTIFVMFSCILGFAIGLLMFGSDKEKLSVSLALGVANVFSIWLMLLLAFIFHKKFKVNGEKMVIFVASYLISFTVLAYIFFKPLYFLL
ncbi:MAG: hypothetical protein KAH57_05425 [Thermoplasmata archaeon]|nr:hypothetical protein [Thermoplasmata archaeon]